MRNLALKRVRLLPGQGWRDLASPLSGNADGKNHRHANDDNVTGNLHPYPALTVPGSDIYPPAIAPMMKKGSAPFTIASGNGLSGGSCDTSSPQMKKRTIGRRLSVP